MGRAGDKKKNSGTALLGRAAELGVEQSTTVAEGVRPNGRNGGMRGTVLGSGALPGGPCGLHEPRSGGYVHTARHVAYRHWVPAVRCTHERSAVDHHFPDCGSSSSSRNHTHWHNASTRTDGFLFCTGVAPRIARLTQSPRLPHAQCPQLRQMAAQTPPPDALDAFIWVLGRVAHSRPRH